MNKRTSVDWVGPELLAVSIAPWRDPGLPGNHGIAGLQSRVADDRLEIDVTPRGDFRSAVAALRALLEFARTILPSGSTVRLGYVDIVLDRVALEAALADWTETEIPVHSIVGFDFGVPGVVPGARSRGLAALVGQEVAAWPADQAQRAVCARMVVRLAHDLLVNGPLTAKTQLPAPDTPRGHVTLTIRDTAPPTVEIEL